MMRNYRTWISIYIFSRAGPAASLQIYYELLNTGSTALKETPKIPMGVSYFPGELIRLPRASVFVPHLLSYQLTYD